MKVYLLIVILALLAGTLWSLYVRRRRASGPVVQTSNQFEFVIQAPMPAAAPLFGAWVERNWATDDWNPKFIYPQPPRDVPGEVFLLVRGGHHSTWVNTALDFEKGHIQYVYFMPHVQVVDIDIQLHPETVQTTHAKVSYRRTALSSNFNVDVTNLGEQDRNAGKEWETSINGYLQRAATNAAAPGSLSPSTH